jgi:type IV pilus assembly protein PilB
VANVQRMTSARLGEILTHSGLITPEQLEEVLAAAKTSPMTLGELLVDRGYLTERDIAQAISTQFGLPYLSPKQYYTSSAVTKLISLDLMRKHRLVPLDRLGDVLTVCISGPVDAEVLEGIEKSSGCTIQVFVAMGADIKAAIEKLAAEEPA